MRPCIIGIGEVLWDVFPDGAAHLGGTVANVAFHANQLGANGNLVSCVGTDRLGNEAVDFLQAHHLSTEYVFRDAARSTGTVEVTLGENGEPSYEIRENVAWDAIPWDEKLAQLAPTADAICFGTLAQRSEPSRSTIRRFVEAARSKRGGSFCVFDVNLRQHFWDADVFQDSLRLADMVKLNDAELGLLAETLHHTSPADFLRDLREKVPFVALTHGARGASLYTPNNADPIFAAPTKPASAGGDSVGAGDAFTAALIVGFLQKLAPGEILARAVRMGAFVAGQKGAMPLLPPEGKESA